MSIPQPKSRKQTRQLLGSIAYFHTLLPNINHILSPIYALSSDKVKFQWKDIHTNALEKAKRLINKCPVLFLPNPDADYFVWTDACIREMCSFFVYQFSNVHKTLVLISCYSHKLTLTERSFSQHHCELFSIVLFVTKFYHKIQHSRTWIFSDCAFLSYAIRYKAENSCLLRYWTLLNSVNIKILFTPSTHPLLHLVDLTTRRNNTLKLLNRRLTQNNVTNFPILDWTGLPPMTLQEIIKIVTGFFNYEAQIKGNLPKAVQINHIKNVNLFQHMPCNDISSNNANTFKIINHFHDLFPKCQLIIHKNNQNCKISNEQIKTNPVMFINQNHNHLPFSIPLPTFAVTSDYQWIIQPHHLFIVKANTPYMKSPSSQYIGPIITDLIINKSTLHHIIKTYFPDLSIPEFINHKKTDKRLTIILNTLNKMDHLNYCIFHDILCKTREVQQHHNQHIKVYTIK